MSLALGGALVALYALVGWWPMRALAPHVAGSSRLGRVSVALILGLLVTGLAQLTLAALGLAVTLVVPCVLALISVVAAWSGGTSQPMGDRAEPGLGGPLAALLGLVVVVATIVAVGLPFRADGSKFWAPKARDLARGPVQQAPSLHDPERIGFHRDYPLLVPALLAPAFALSAPDAHTGPKLVLHAFTLALLGCSAVLLVRRGASGRWLLAGLLSMPLLAATDVRESLVSGGFVDAAIAVELLLLVDAVQRLRAGQGGRTDVLLAALLGAALMATKLEGVVEFAIVAAAWCLAGPRRRLLPAVVAVAGLLAIPALILFLQAGESPPIAIPGLLLDGRNLAARGLPVLAGLGGVFLDASCFGLLPLALVWWAWRGPRADPDRFVLWLALGAASFLALVYLATSMHVGRHLYTSVHRLAFHWMPAFTVLLAGPAPPASSAGEVVRGRR